MQTNTLAYSAKVSLKLEELYITSLSIEETIRLWQGWVSFTNTLAYFVMVLLVHQKQLHAQVLDNNSPMQMCLPVTNTLAYSVKFFTTKRVLCYNKHMQESVLLTNALAYSAKVLLQRKILLNNMPHCKAMQMQTNMPTYSIMLLLHLKEFYITYLSLEPADGR